MKKLFVLMALAGLAAFQVGCGESAPTGGKTQSPATGLGGAGPGNMPAMALPGAEAKKGDEKPADEAAPTGDEKPDDAAPTEEKKDE